VASVGESPTGAGESAVAVRCEGLVKRYGALLAVAGLDLEVRRGECFGLLGPNGAGKTTTVEILEGLTRPDEGSVEVLGCRWGEGCDQELRQRFGVALQETQLADKLTVTETLRLFRSFYRQGHTVGEVIGLVELEDKRHARVGKLSGGQRQRLALACALVCDPEVLFLDEPTTGLDPQARHKVWEIVEDFRARGGSVLLTTHYMEEAARLCDRVAIMDRGRIISLGAPAQLVASLGGEQIVEMSVEGELDRETLAALPGVRGVALRNGDVQVTVDDIGAALRGLLDAVAVSGVRLGALRTHQATLEDVFVQLTGRGLRDE
jgi:ABC-2 type transport system ATP-binding protein